MNRPVLALLPLAAALFVSFDAGAFGMPKFETNGTNPYANQVAPSTVCDSLSLYLADVPADATKTRRYRFTGTCTLNVAKEGQAPIMKTVDVLLDAEYMPKMRRASERVVVQHPDLGVELSTWATCPADPFVAKVACTDKGLGANKFDKFISREDAPFAKNRATAGQVQSAMQRLGDNGAKFWANPTFGRIQPIGAAKAGASTQVKIDAVGGAGVCPVELDFGDGSKARVKVWEQQPFTHAVTHAFAKPGAYKVTARTLPGCVGGESGPVYAFVK